MRLALLSCLAWVVHGKRVLTPRRASPATEPFTEVHSDDNPASNSFEALATLLAVSEPASAFRASNAAGKVSAAWPSLHADLARDALLESRLRLRGGADEEEADEEETDDEAEDEAEDDEEAEGEDEEDEEDEAEDDDEEVEAEAEADVDESEKSSRVVKALPKLVVGSGLVGALLFGVLRQGDEAAVAKGPKKKAKVAKKKASKGSKRKTEVKAKDQNEFWLDKQIDNFIDSLKNIATSFKEGAEDRLEGMRN